MQQDKADEEAWQGRLQRVMRSIQGQEPAGRFVYSQAASHSPVIDFVDSLLEEAVRCRASDIHLEPGDSEARIRFRIDGGLVEAYSHIPLKAQAFFVSRLKVMAGLDTTERRLPLDGRIRYRFQDGSREIDVRMATMPLLTGEKAVLRLLDVSEGLLSIDGLLLSDRNEKMFRHLCHSPGGMLLICGPTNSGKTTSLYAALREMNQALRNITTLEDPPEYHLAGINQMQVNIKKGLTFANGLKAILRSDPDVVMIGEIRDEETAEIAVRAALAGRLIFSTLHAARAAGAVQRILDMGIPPYLLASALLGVISQRLVRQRCQNCMGKTGKPGSKEAVCPICHGTGFQGRLAIQEVMVIDDVLREAVMQRLDVSDMEKLAEQQGMVTMLEDGMQKAAQGLTTAGEVRRVLYGEA